MTNSPKAVHDVVNKFLSILGKFPEVSYVGFDPVLRQKTQEVSVAQGILIGERLGEVLMRYRKEAGYGRGFAAPQIGESKAVFVTYVADELEIFINPTIIEKSKETNFYRELCLSSGIMVADVKRSEWVVMEWININGKKRREKFDGFLSRLYQHEVAYLNGVVNLDEAEEGGIEIMNFDPLKEQLRKIK